MDKCKTFMLAIKHFFGYGDNKTLLKECKELDPSSRKELASLLCDKGYPIQHELNTAA